MDSKTCLKTAFLLPSQANTPYYVPALGIFDILIIIVRASNLPNQLATIRLRSRSQSSMRDEEAVNEGMHLIVLPSIAFSLRGPT